MKIVQFMASEGFGGAEKVFIELANALALEHEVTALLLRNATIGERFSQDVRTIYLNSHPTSNNPFLHLELYSRLKELQPDIIHTHAAKGTTLVARVNRLLGFNHLGTKHNDRKGRIFNSMRWVSAVSEKAGKSILPARDAHIWIIHNAVVPEVVENFPREDVFTIIAVGRLDRIKGFDILIDQVKGLAFDFCLQIIGEGPEKDRLEKKIREYNLTGKITLVGFRDDIPQCMKKAHLVVISSHQEGGPKVMIESLFYANALIATPVGAVPEVLPAMFQCSQDQLGRKIAEVHSRYDEYVKQFKKVAEQKREDFAIPRIVGKYLDLYGEMLKAKAQSLDRAKGRGGTKKSAERKTKK